MAYDVGRVQDELQGAGVAVAFPLEVAVAVICDTLRLAGLLPPTAERWRRWHKAHALLPEQAAALAHMLVSTSLREQCVASLVEKAPALEQALGDFFDAVRPLTAEMLRNNRFRQEEFLRRFVDSTGGVIQGETDAKSQKRLAQLDYRKTLAEYGKAEAEQAKEAARRAQLLREAAQREEQAKGWRE